VKKYYPNENPLGKPVYLGAPDNRLFDSAPIVGVVGNTRDLGLGTDPIPTVYIPQAVMPMWRGFSYVIRTTGEPTSVAAAARAVMREIDPGLPVRNVRTVDVVLAESMAPTRWSMTLLGVFAGVAVIMAALGVFGVLSFLVTQRTRELGIRIALGAAPGAVRRMVVAQALALGAAGLALGLAGATLVHFVLAPAAAFLIVGVLRPRLALACVLVVTGWWWGSERLRGLERSALASQVGTGGRARVRLQEPPRRGRFEVRVRALVTRWAGARVHEVVLLKLPGARAPPQGATLRVLGTLRAPSDFERTWLRRHGVHVVLRASAWQRVRMRGGLADRLHAWLSRASTPGLTGERRAVLQGVVLGEDGGLSDTLRQRFRASGLYHLLAVSGGNVLVVAGGTVGVVLLVGLSRFVAEAFALLAIGAYVLAVGPQPSVLRAGIAGALGSLAWLTGRERDRWYALLFAAVVLLAWNPYTVLDPGFQLSFAAVVSIFALAPRIRRTLDGYPVPGRLADCIAISTACGLCTAPISWLHFRAIPLLTVPANAAAAPVVAPMLALALLAAILPPIGPVLSALNGWCAAYLAGCARLFGGLPGAQVRSPAGAAALASVVLFAAAYAWRRGERAEAGLPAHRQRPAEDRPRGSPAS